MAEGQRHRGVLAVVLTEGGLCEVRLSDREIEVLERVAEGRSNREIGAELGLSGATVKVHLYRIGQKFRTGDRTHMVVIAMRAAIIT